MLRKLARRVLFLLVGLAVVGGVLYAAGLRIVQYGGGGIGFSFTKSADQRAAEIEEHREAQRAQAPAPAPAPVMPDPAAFAPSASPTADKPSPAVVRASSHWTSFRGPHRDGYYRQQPVRTDWGGALTALWKQPVAAPRQANAPLDDRVAAVVKSPAGVPSVSVAVMRDGKMLLERACGVADIEPQ